MRTLSETYPLFGGHLGLEDSCVPELKPPPSPRQLTDIGHSRVRQQYSSGIKNIYYFLSGADCRYVHHKERKLPHIFTNLS